MENNNFFQKAKNNSLQTQIGSVIVNNGVDEKRVREICDEVYKNEIKSASLESEEIARKRNDAFVEIFISKIKEIDNALEILKDPRLNYDIAIAQKTASCSDNIDDYELLSELMRERMKNNGNRIKALNIRKAIEIVDQIDERALCGLTGIYLLSKLVVLNNQVVNGLRTLNEIYSSVLTLELPSGTEWYKHLELLNLVNYTDTRKYIDFKSLFNKKEKFKIGIEKDSDNHKIAIEMLEKVNISKNFLIENELLRSHVILNFDHSENFENLFFIKSGKKVPINDEQKNCINQILNMYSKEAYKKEELANNFIKLWDSYDSLKKIHEWYNNLDTVVMITPVGEIITQCNAEKCKEMPKIHM